MATPEQRRQKKLAKKRSKELAKKKTQARQKATLQSLAGQMQVAGQGIVHRCFISEACFAEVPSGEVILSRFLPDGRVGFAFLSVDAACRGVKFADGNVCFPSQINEVIEKAREVEQWRQIAPEAARKFVQGAIDYARKNGFEPAANYRRVEAIWGDIDAAQCDTEFRYGGPEGKPFLVCSPDDDPVDSFRLVAKLNQHLGEDNFDVDYEAVLDHETYRDDEYSETNAYDDPELDVDIDEDVDPGLLEENELESDTDLNPERKNNS